MELSDQERQELAHLMGFQPDYPLTKQTVKDFLRGGDVVVRSELIANFFMRVFTD